MWNSIAVNWSLRTTQVRVKVQFLLVLVLRILDISWSPLPPSMKTWTFHSCHDQNEAVTEWQRTHSHRCP